MCCRDTHMSAEGHRQVQQVCIGQQAGACTSSHETSTGRESGGGQKTNCSSPSPIGDPTTACAVSGPPAGRALPGFDRCVWAPLRETAQSTRAPRPTSGWRLQLAAAVWTAHQQLPLQATCTSACVCLHVLSASNKVGADAGADAPFADNRSSALTIYTLVVQLHWQQLLQMCCKGAELSQRCVMCRQPQALLLNVNPLTW